MIGETDAHGERSKGRLITPSNVLSMLYRHLGIDPATTIADNNGRPDRTCSTTASRSKS